MKIKNFINILFLIFSNILLGQNPQVQSNFGSPISYPTPPSVYSFTKYGDFPVNEYRGLANITIPLYEFKLDEVNIPLKLTYFTGGIKVAEEAGIVGLGWDMNFPSIVQTIKDEDDFSSFTVFTKLPDYVGSTFLPTRGNFHPIVYQNHPYPPSSWEGMPYYGTSINFLDEPSFFISSGNFVVINGQYNNTSSTYGEFIYNYNHINDSEADIFKLTLNGVELVMIRSSESMSLNTQSLSQFIAVNSLKIINGRDEYKAETIGNTSSTNLGIKITDPNGTQYFFEKINVIHSNSGSELFMHYANTGATSINIYKIFNMTKIITAKNKNIILEYDTNQVIELGKENQTYYKRIGNTNKLTNIRPCGLYDLITHSVASFNHQQDGLTYFTDTSSDNGYSYNGSTQYQSYNFLKKIISDDIKIDFNYSDRLDYQGMKKLDNIKVKNVNNEIIKNFNLSYDYFVSTLSTNNFGEDGNPDNSGEDDGLGNTPTNPPPTNNSPIFNRIHKRLKLISLCEQGQNPYVFDYNSTLLPPKYSFSVDYWGYYSGWNNTSFLLSLQAIGYSTFLGSNNSDNIQNNFNANLDFTKAATLEKIKYPTGGYTVFEYQLNEFDDYLKHTDANTPTINQGAGLRIFKISNFISDDILSDSKTFIYYGGKNIFKKQLSKVYNTNILELSDYMELINVSISDAYQIKGNEYHSLVLECSLSNYLSASVIGVEDYIGYDKVEQKDSFKGKISKEFVNIPYQVYSSDATRNYNPLFFKKRFDLNNGNLSKEYYYDENNNVKLKKEYFYSIITSNIKRYGVNVNNYDLFDCIVGIPINDAEVNIPSYLLTFYPIFSNSNLLSGERTSQYFNSGSITKSTSYIYDFKNNLTNKTTTLLPNTIIAEENKIMSYNNNPVHILKNIFNFPYLETYKEYGDIKQCKEYEYEESNGITQLKKQLLLPQGNPDPSKKIILFYDQYDDKHNLSQFHRDNDIYTSIIWGYKKTLPVAKLENIKYNDIPAGLILAIQNASDVNDENALLQALNSLRDDISLGKVRITSYTHLPLIGISTVTDFKGNKVTYSYDNFGKLINVKDNDGNIISENQYNFKP